MSKYPNDGDGDALARIAASGSDMTQPMAIDFIVVVPDEQAGLQVAEAAKGLGYETKVVYDEGEEDSGEDAEWTCYCTKTMMATHDGVIEAQDELDVVAKPLGGYTDGWGSFGNVDSEIDPSSENVIREGGDERIVGTSTARMNRLALLLRTSEESIRALPHERLMDGFDTNVAFAEFIGDCRANLESGQLPRPMQQRLQLAFLPTSDWDDCLIDVDLGNEIDDLIRELFGETGS